MKLGWTEIAHGTAAMVACPFLLGSGPGPTPAWTDPRARQTTETILCKGDVIRPQLLSSARPGRRPAHRTDFSRTQRHKTLSKRA